MVSENSSNTRTGTWEYLAFFLIKNFKMSIHYQIFSWWTDYFFSYPSNNDQVYSFFLTTFFVSCSVEQILKSNLQVGEFQIHQNIFGRRTLYILFVRPRSALHCGLTPTSLSWAFDLLHYMSRAFRGQVVRHEHALQLCSVIQCIFLLLACFFFCLSRWKMSARLWPPTHF